MNQDLANEFNAWADEYESNLGSTPPEAMQRAKIAMLENKYLGKELPTETKPKSVEETPQTNKREITDVWGNPLDPKAQRLIEAGFPSSVEAYRAGNLPLASVAEDVLSTPGRLGRAVYGKLVGDTETPEEFLGEFRQRTGETGSTIGDIITDPSAIPSMMIPGIGAAGSFGSKLIKGAIYGAGTQAPLSYVSQQAKAERGEDFDKEQAATEVGLSTLAGIAGPVIESGFKLVSKPIKSTASKLSQTDLPVLEYVGGKELKQAVKKLVGNNTPDEQLEAISNYNRVADNEIGRIKNKIETRIDRKKNLIGKKADDALADMDDVDLNDFISDLELKKADSYSTTDMLNQTPTKETEAYDEIINHIKGSGDHGNIHSAFDANKLKQEIYDGGKYSASNPDKATKVYRKVGNLLNRKLRGQGNTKFNSAMDDFKKVLDYDDVYEKTMLNVRNPFNVKKSQSMVEGLSNKPKLEHERFFNETKKVLNIDISPKKLLDIAKKYDGGLNIMPRYNLSQMLTAGTAIGGAGTASAMGAINPALALPVAGLASPKIAAPIVGGINKMSDLLSTDPSTYVKLARPGISGMYNQEN